MASNLDLYRREIFNFLRTVTIKFEPFAYLMGESYMNAHGLTNPHGKWNPYYIHLAGEYTADELASDDVMHVSTIEHELPEDVIFSKDLKITNPKTAAIYKIPNDEYFHLEEQYPKHAGLLRCMVYPVSNIDEAIAAPNLTLLVYDDSLLEVNERESIVKCLKSFLDMVRTRWWIEEYTYEDMGIINELKELKNENVDFNTEHGAYTAGYTTWTMAAMLAQTAGIPLNLSFDGNSMSSFNTFFPGLYNLGNILEDNGYNNYFAIGSDAKFGGRKNYFEQHGNYQIWDLNSALENKYMSIKDVVFWGYDDSDLIKYAKMQLSDIDTKTPFNYTMLTVNTHHMDGWLEDDCETNYDTQYANVISCSSRQITEFVNWLKEQDFYNNTTIIISGDHTSMNKAFFENLDENYIRTTYVTVINPAIGYTKGNREYSTMDLFPTTLASLGVKIDGDRLGLGTNLFSSKYTLSEIYGRDNLDLELSKKSSFYDEKFSVPILREK